jgi:hypothetical protein
VVDGAFPRRRAGHMPILLNFRAVCFEFDTRGLGRDFWSESVLAPGFLDSWDRCMPWFRRRIGRTCIRTSR